MLAKLSDACRNRIDLYTKKLIDVYTDDVLYFCIKNFKLLKLAFQHRDKLGTFHLIAFDGFPDSFIMPDYPAMTFKTVSDKNQFFRKRPEKKSSGRRPYSARSSGLYVPLE